jgi:hypothetical protein
MILLELVRVCQQIAQLKISQATKLAMESVVDKLMDLHNNVMQNSCSFGEVL